MATGAGRSLATAVPAFGARCEPDAKTRRQERRSGQFQPRAVIQRGLWVATQARIPVVAAPAVIALAMHCMHMGARLAPQPKAAQL